MDMEQDLVYVISQKYLDTWAQPADTFTYLVPHPLAVQHLNNRLYIFKHEQFLTHL